MISTANGQTTELGQLHDRVRRGEFDSSLLRRVKACDRQWRALKRDRLADYIQGRCVVAETLDYFGHYAAAQEALVADDCSELEQLVETRRDLTPTDAAIMKRRIWLAMAKALVAYRAERYAEADHILDLASVVANKLDPEQKALCGTRARLAHTQGQVARQRGDYSQARRWFCAAVSWATKRFVAKTPFAELDKPVAKHRSVTAAEQLQFDQARHHANWTIGKALALGIGWIDSTTGRLATAEMHLSAGYALLRTTGDWLHRAYAMLLLGVVQRAQAGTDKAMLGSAIARMEDAERGLVGHPFELRAHYELAQAYLRRGDTEEARRRIKAMLDARPNHLGAQSHRWKCNGTIVWSRIERIAGDIDRAERLARQAEQLVGAAKGARVTSEAWLEAKIVRGEALVARANSARTDKERRETLAEARGVFETARERSAGNPKTLAVCHLHLARILSRTGEGNRARTEFDAWAHHLMPLVEHGFVHSLAEDVWAELEREESFYLAKDLTWRDACSAAPRPVTWKEARTRFESFLGRRACALRGSQEGAAALLDVTVRTVRRWMKADKE